jgi:hypothetical protein
MKWAKSAYHSGYTSPTPKNETYHGNVAEVQKALQSQNFQSYHEIHRPSLSATKAGIKSSLLKASVASEIKGQDMNEVFQILFCYWACLKWGTFLR